MSKLDDILGISDRSIVKLLDFNGQVTKRDVKDRIKDFVIELAYTHSDDDQNINLASFVAEIKHL